MDGARVASIAPRTVMVEFGEGRQHWGCGEQIGQSHKRPAIQRMQDSIGRLQGRLLRVHQAFLGYRLPRTNARHERPRRRNFETTAECHGRQARQPGSQQGAWRMVCHKNVRARQCKKVQPGTGLPEQCGMVAPAIAQQHFGIACGRPPGASPAGDQRRLHIGKTAAKTLRCHARIAHGKADAMAGTPQAISHRHTARQMTEIGPHLPGKKNSRHRLAQDKRTAPPCKPASGRKACAWLPKLASPITSCAAVILMPASVPFLPY